MLIRGRIDEYVHLNNDKSGNISIKAEGIELSIPVDKLTDGLLQSNRGVHRVLSKLYHNCLAEAKKEDDKFSRYGDEFREMAKRLEAVVEVFYV